ncbi:MAG: hypothetical protein VX681_12695 [Myxococcota bacterium]|nr:hypothetical protein [Myxococcota bacterium]
MLCRLDRQLEARLALGVLDQVAPIAPAEAALDGGEQDLTDLGADWHRDIPLEKLSS